MNVLHLFSYVAITYITNATPVLIKGKRPVDSGIKLRDGYRLLGDGKTIEGTVASLIVGFISVFLFIFLFNIEFWKGALLVVGSIVGDFLGSFLKRRFGIKRGEPFFGLDQLDFFVFSFFISGLVFEIPFTVFLTLVVLTLFLHKFSNYLAYKLKMKRVPW